jgi:cobalt/nickel transport system permease protein
MHIPDGYLSPATSLSAGAVMVPAWWAACRRVRGVIASRYAPLVALGAAYTFLVMMFNVPVPDGTTAHAVGAVLIAILLGPSAAVIAVSVALAIQALFFGDGGVVAYCVNAFNMALVMPMVGYATYRVLAHRSTLQSRRRAIAAGLGGYIGLNAAALAVAIELGVQPVLFHAADGTPSYSPFHLRETLPAMALAHLTLAGAVEFVLTASVFAYLQRVQPSLLTINDAGAHVAPTGRPSVTRRLLRWATACLGLGALVVPLGLLAHGAAFAEQPRGAATWRHVLFRAYGLPRDAHPALGYVVSACIGIAAIVAVVFVLAFAISHLRSVKS